MTGDLHELSLTLSRHVVLPTVVNESGSTLLHVACFLGRVDMVLLLLLRGANINTQDNSCFSPLMVALQFLHADCANILIERGADLNIFNVIGHTALHVACIFGCFDSIQCLLDNDANPNAIDFEGRTPLMCAIPRGHVQAVHILLSNKSTSIAILDGKGQDAFMLLEQMGMMNQLGIYDYNLREGGNDAGDEHKPRSSGALSGSKSGNSKRHGQEMQVNNTSLEYNTISGWGPASNPNRLSVQKMVSWEDEDGLALEQDAWGDIDADTLAETVNDTETSKRFADLHIPSLSSSNRFPFSSNPVDGMGICEISNSSHSKVLLSEEARDTFPIDSPTSVLKSRNTKTNNVGGNGDADDDGLSVVSSLTSNSLTSSIFSMKRNARLFREQRAAAVAVLGISNGNLITSTDMALREAATASNQLHQHEVFIIRNPRDILIPQFAAKMWCHMNPINLLKFVWGACEGVDKNENNDKVGIGQDDNVKLDEEPLSANLLTRPLQLPGQLVPVESHASTATKLKPRRPMSKTVYDKRLLTEGPASVCVSVSGLSKDKETRSEHHIRRNIISTLFCIE